MFFLRCFCPVWVLVRVFASRANMPLGCSRLLAVVLLRFQRVAEDITGGLDAFCVGVGVHFERDAFIGMTEFSETEATSAWFVMAILANVWRSLCG